MQGMFFTGNSVVEAINIDKVGPASGEVLLEMKASGVCAVSYTHQTLPTIYSV